MRNYFCVIKNAQSDWVMIPKPSGQYLTNITSVIAITKQKSITVMSPLIIGTKIIEWILIKKNNKLADFIKVASVYKKCCLSRKLIISQFIIFIMWRKGSLKFWNLIYDFKLSRSV